MSGEAEESRPPSAPLKIGASIGADYRKEVVRHLTINERPFLCPASMIPTNAEVFEGEYALCDPIDDLRSWCPLLPKEPTVLDLGGNCGSFSVWATLVLGPSIVHVYEPNPEMWDLLVQNLSEFNVPASATRAAVSDHDGEVQGGEHRPLWYGLNNAGEASLIRKPLHKDDDCVIVELVTPSSLPSCHIVKVDTEGLEEHIIRRLDLSATEIVMFEFHTAYAARVLNEFLTTIDLALEVPAPLFELFSGYWRNPNTGVLRYRRVRDENRKAE